MEVVSRLCEDAEEDDIESYALKRFSLWCLNFTSILEPEEKNTLSYLGKHKTAIQHGPKGGQRLASKWSQHHEQRFGALRGPSCPQVDLPEKARTVAGQNKRRLEV